VALISSVKKLSPRCIEDLFENHQNNS